MKTHLSILAAAGVVALGSASSASASTVIATNCVSVADTHGCLFDGNINNNPDPGNANGFKNAEAAYNLFNNTHPSANPDITLTFLGDTDVAGFPGTFTGAGTSSGTWSLPGLSVGYVAVKASDKFVLYKLAAAASAGTWNTIDIPFNNNPHAISHLLFFGPDVGINPLGVPEPATWAMLLGGFGLVGAVTRRRRRTSVTFA